MASISQPSTAVTTLIKVHSSLTILFFLLPSAIMDTKQQIRLSLMQPTKELLLLQFWVRMPLTTGAAAHAALICHGRSCFLSQPPAHTVHEPFGSYGVPSPKLVTCGYSSTVYYRRFTGHATTLSQTKPGYMAVTFPGTASSRTNSLRPGLSPFRYSYLSIFARR